MALGTPTRHALVDLPVNTFGTPSGTLFTDKSLAGHKRPIGQVDEPEMQENALRMRSSSTWSESTVKGATTSTKAAESDGSKMLSFGSVPAAPGSPEPSEASDDSDSQTTHKGSQSSTMDFDADETTDSQQTAATEVTQPLRSAASQHVENLRLRLRLAQFKVRTNQINVPFSRLRISTEEAHDLRAPPPTNRLLPAPVLQPTAYSARMIPRPQIDSSPPTSPTSSPARPPQDDAFRTPALPRHGAPVASQQTSSPPESPERYKQGRKAESLTSSAVRGKAAISLLGLRAGQC